MLSSYMYMELLSPSEYFYTAFCWLLAKAETCRKLYSKTLQGEVVIDCPLFLPSFPRLLLVALSGSVLPSVCLSTK